MQVLYPELSVRLGDTNVPGRHLGIDNDDVVARFPAYEPLYISEEVFLPLFVVEEDHAAHDTGVGYAVATEGAEPVGVAVLLAAAGAEHHRGPLSCSGNVVCVAMHLHRNREIRSCAFRQQEFDLLDARLQQLITDLPSMSFYGAWDVREARWSDDLLERFDLVRDQFGQPTAPGTQVGTISPVVAEQTGFAVDTPICVGAYDQACGIVGMGSIEPGMATATLGTGGFTNLVVDTPTTALGGMLTNHHAVSGLWQVGGASLAAASSYQWFRDTFGALEVEREKQQKGNAFAALNDLAAQAPPGSRGVLFLPYLNSAGTPHWNPHARAAFIGMSVAHGRAELTRSVMEGITLEMHDTMTGWHNNGMALTTLRLGGGPTHSPLWNQIQADVYGRMVQIMCVEESTALGAAILGGIGAGVFDSVQEGVDAMVHVANEIEPNIENHDIYQEMYRAYIEAYEGLNHKAFGTLAAMQVNTSR